MDLLIIVLILLLAGAVVYLFAKNIASHSFRCRHCSREFRIAWTKAIITEHSGNEYKLVCPFCKAKDWCSQQLK